MPKSTHVAQLSSFVFLLCVILLSVPASAIAAPPSLQAMAQQFIACAQPSFQSGELLDEGVTGFGIDLDGDRYWVAVMDRVVLPLQASRDAPPVATLRLDRPVVEEFQEQMVWRQRLLQHTASLMDVPVQETPLADGARLLTANKKILKGKYAGLSLIVDQKRQLFVQIEWTRLPSYTTMREATAMQEAVLARLRTCLPKV